MILKYRGCGGIFDYKEIVRNKPLEIDCACCTKCYREDNDGRLFVVYEEGQARKK